MATSGWIHLVKRFLGSLSPSPPSREDRTWVESVLTPGQQELWGHMTNPDKRHSVAVARAVETELGLEATRSVCAAALLHDVGKVQSGLGTPGRVAATVAWSVLPSDLSLKWSSKQDFRGRLGRYRRHPEIGEQMLAEVGSDELVSRWSGDHHRPEVEWRVALATGRVLKACDDD